MAEVVGIAAAAVQFIELGTKLLIAASKLCSKLENAPEKAKTSERSVRRLVSLVRTLETDLQPTSSTTLADILTNESKLEAEDILEECRKEASALLDLLHSFIAKADDNFVKGKMRAFAYVKKEDEVAERCKRLDELSSRLVLWYHHQTLSLQKRQLDALFSTDNTINAIGSQMHARFTAVEHYLHQQQSAMTLRPSSPATPVSSSLAFNRRPGQISLGNAYLPGCTCRRSHLMKSTSNAGPFSLMSRQSGLHERSCPYYGKNLTRDSRIAISFSLPRLFSQRVQLSFTNSYANGAYSIFPTLRTANIVDVHTSPAFSHIRIAFWNVMDLLDERFGYIFFQAVDIALICPLQKILKTLFLELSQDFRSGASSAMDVSSDGRSMLHDLFRILGMVCVYEDYLTEIAGSLLQLLIDFGIDINAESQELHKGSTTHGNAIFMFKTGMELAYLQHQVDSGLPFIHMLYRTGIDVPVWSKPAIECLLGPSIFSKLPGLALEVGFPKLTFAVISRNEHDLRALLRAGHSVDEIYIQPFTPLCYSIGWPEGYQILLDSGADPDLALLTAFKYLDGAFVERLLEAGCVLFANNSPLTRFLCVTGAYTGCEDKKSQILSLLTNAMADSRRGFMRLALDNVPRQALIQRGWMDPSINGPLLHYSAIEVARLLKNLKIQIPRNLNPGFRRSVYHEKYLTAQAAQSLYSCGFVDIDLPDRYGCTPFMLCLIRISQYEDEYVREIPMSWLLDRGISILSCSSIPGFNLLHLLSACYQREFSYTLAFQKLAQELADLDTVVHRLSRLCDPYSRDLCQCWCSNGGCLPLTLLFKRLRPRWISIQYAGHARRRCTSWDAINETLKDWIRWYGCDPADQTLLEEICRLEVFQRLGMAHTCCEIHTPWNSHLGYWELSASFVSNSERQQFQDEDACSKVQLDALLDTYTALFTQYSGSVERLWTVWWEILENYLPQRVWILETDGGCFVEDYVELDNPWCNGNLLDPQDLWTKTGEIKRRVTAAMTD